MTVQSCVVQCITQFSANEKRETCEILWERREESSLEAGEVCDVEGGGWGCGDASGNRKSVCRVVLRLLESPSARAG